MPCSKTHIQRLGLTWTPPGLTICKEKANLQGLDMFAQSVEAIPFLSYTVSCSKSIRSLHLGHWSNVVFGLWRPQCLQLTAASKNRRYHDQEMCGFCAECCEQPCIFSAQISSQTAHMYTHVISRDEAYSHPMHSKSFQLPTFCSAWHWPRLRLCFCGLLGSLLGQSLCLLLQPATG